MKEAMLRPGPGRVFVAALAIVGFLAAAAPAPPPLPALNEKVVAFARERLGTSVGDGSCSTLAIAALRASGARCYPEQQPDGELVWGEPVESFKEALPGDVLQFHNAVFRGRKTLPGNRWITWHHEYPHHTAIVSKVSPGAKSVTVLHQNVTGPGQEGKDSKNVQETTLPLDSLQKGGWVHIFRPLPARRSAGDPLPRPAPPEGDATDTPDR